MITHCFVERKVGSGFDVIVDGYQGLEELEFIVQKVPLKITEAKVKIKLSFGVCLVFDNHLQLNIRLHSIVV